jgi:site-specific recombinase XerD
MTKTNAANERIKRAYFTFLRDAQGRDESTIDGVAKSLARFEQATGARDFGRFHREQAVNFKRKLSETANARTGERLSKATILATLRDLRTFFEWLSREPGFRKRIAYSDADYFNLPDKAIAVARAKREPKAPMLDQVRHVIAIMPTATPVERRNRALIAFTVVTTARVGALASFRLGHVDIEGGYVEQDARTVRTKGAKSFRTIFMPFDGAAVAIVADWVTELRRDHLFGPDDPLFPATAMGLDDNGMFVPTGLLRQGWSSTGPVRDVFRSAFALAGLPYYNPHSFRSMIIRHAMTLDLTPEEMKALSQNLGHSDVLTTFTSYGTVPMLRQAALIAAMGSDRDDPQGASADDLARLADLVAKMRRGAERGLPDGR